MYVELSNGTKTRKPLRLYYTIGLCPGAEGTASPYAPEQSKDLHAAAIGSLCADDVLYGLELPGHGRVAAGDGTGVRRT